MEAREADEAMRVNDTSTASTKRNNELSETDSGMEEPPTQPPRGGASDASEATAPEDGVEQTETEIEQDSAAGNSAKKPRLQHSDEEGNGRAQGNDGNGNNAAKKQKKGEQAPPARDASMDQGINENLNANLNGDLPHQATPGEGTSTPTAAKTTARTPTTNEKSQETAQDKAKRLGLRSARPATKPEMPKQARPVPQAGSRTETSEARQC